MKKFTVEGYYNGEWSPEKDFYNRKEAENFIKRTQAKEKALGYNTEYRITKRGA